MLLLIGCTEQDTDPEEEPPPPAEEEVETAPVLGVDIGMVLPPRDALAPAVTSAIIADLDRLQAAYADDVNRVRAVSPDGPPFIRDLAGVLVRDGADLVCVFGGLGRPLISELRELYPDRRFCAVTTGDPPDEPEHGIDIITLRIGELGHLIGAGAAALADGEAVALALGPAEAEQGRFVEALRAGLGTTPVVEVDPELPAEQAVADAVADGASVLLVGTGPEADTYLAAGVARDLLVVTYDGDGQVEQAEAVALTWTLQWDLVFRPAVDRLLGRDEPAPLSLGLAEDAFAVVPGPAAPSLLAPVLGGIEQALIDGTRDPYEPVEEDDEDEEDEDEAVQDEE